MSKLYSVEELAKELAVTTRTIRNYLKDGKLKGTKIGGQWRFSVEDLAEFIGLETDYEINNANMYHFLETVHLTEQAAVVLDFPITSFETFELFRTAVINHYNQVYDGSGRRSFQYELLPNKVARFSLSGPTAYVLLFSQQIYQFAQQFRS